MIINRYCLFILLISSSIFSHSQIPDSSKISPQLPKNYYSGIDKKINNIIGGLSKKSKKYLEKFQGEEQNFKQKIEKFHPGSTGDLFDNGEEKYKALLKQIDSSTLTANEIPDGEYNPYIDSLNTSLSFLKQFTGISEKVEKPLASLNNLQNKLQQSEKIKEFISERKKKIKELLSTYTKIPAGLRKEYQKISKTAYYYSAQVKEYKELLSDPKRAEQKALSILNSLPAFQKFINQNGQLASLFRLNENTYPALSLANLQTRSSVREIMQQKIIAGGPNAGQILQQNIALAKSELDKLKDKVSQHGGGSSDPDMPDFKPNDEKTKPFSKRLEYAVNIQFGKTSNLLPSAGNIGLGIGYKLNGKSIIGLGMSYKIGIGSIKHISITSEAIGFRSYMDWKIKKQIYASGGYEVNYNTAFKNIEQLRNYNAWQRSALAGISKKYKINKKVKGEIKLLYDFLANQHIPVSQAFVFRMGYTLQ